MHYLLTHRPGWYLFDAAGFRGFPAKVFTPLLFLSLDVDRRLFGLASGPFYLHHLLVFALCPAVLYGVLRLWLPRLWSATGATIFSLGPAAASLAPLLMVRHYIEAILLAALAVAAWAKGRPWISAVLYFAACMAKEIAVPLVVLLPLLPSPAGGRPMDLRERLREALPLGNALTVYLGLRYAALGTFAGGYGFTADLPGLALALPGKIAMEIVGGRFSWAAVVLGITLVAGVLAILLKGRRTVFLTVLALLLAILPVLPVSTKMEPRYAVPAWLVLAVAFAAGGRVLEDRSRRTAWALAAVALVSGLWLNRQDWSVRFVQAERMSAENRFLLGMSAGDTLRQPATLAASLKELEWMRQNAFHRPAGGSWFQDDLYLCLHRDLSGRIWGYDSTAHRVVDLTPRISSLRAQHCSSVRSSAQLRANFRVAEGNLLWELGPYPEGRYVFLLRDGAEAFEMPRSAGFQVAGLPELPLRIRYESPDGWTTYSPELRLEIREGVSVRWSRPSPLKLAPCHLPKVDREARCGTYEVFENRAAGSGRKIPLRVVVIPAAGKPVAPDPLVFFEGGPGVSSVESAPDVIEEFGAVLQHRDLLLVDFRGTGGSHPLLCPQPEGVHGVEEALDTFMDPGAVRRCREVLARDNDLTQYTTDTSVDDVEEVRAALGYPKVNLAGASYGTRAALVYLRRHPESVRTVQISSVLPANARIPMFLAAHTQAAFQRVVQDCAAEPSCHAAFPDPRADLETVLKRLEAEPATVTVQDGNGKATTLRLTRNGVVQTVRYMLYRPAGVQSVPLLLCRAAAGDLEPLAQTAYDLASALLASPPDGLYLSVTCAEDVAFVDREQALRLSAGTFVGDLRLRQQIAACAEWPFAKIPPSFLKPVRSDVPALIVAGENDPATPREWAEKVARTLPHSRLLVVPGGTHTVYGLEGTRCIDRLIADFIDRGTAEGLDFESCRKAIRRPPFAVRLE